MNFVKGSGPVPCNIMVIGEAPGKTEDEQGVPFVGKAGQILDSALEAAGIPRDTVYVTNVYKHRPPNNRKPTWDEINSHLGFLVEELKEVNPKFILLLGGTSLETFTGISKIGQVHGTRLFEPADLYWDIGPDAAQAYWYCTYHPAATVYRKELLDDFRNDVKTFGEIATGEYSV